MRGCHGRRGGAQTCQLVQADPGRIVDCTPLPAASTQPAARPVNPGGPMEAWEISEQKAAGTLPRKWPWSEPGGKSMGKTSLRCSRVFFGKVLVLLEGLG